MIINLLNHLEPQQTEHSHVQTSAIDKWRQTWDQLHLVNSTPNLSIPIFYQLFFHEQFIFQVGLLWKNYF